jgi:large-conductance mechanosensitive channel
MSDWVAIGSYLTVIVSIVIIGYLVYKVVKLINTTKSED